MVASLSPLLRRICRLAHSPTMTRESDAELLDRFARQRDESAFAALVDRHGRMVLDVCRRVLADEQAAEDAAQATLLVLARKAGAIGRPEALAGWLYGVARQVACKARGAGRRRAQALPLAGALLSDPHPDPLAELTVRELLTIVDDEMLRLPEVYRLPVLLCCLENKTQEEAALQLGWTLGSVKGRLERGRKRLHERLARRGIVPAAALTALEVARGAAAAQLPGSLTGAAVVAALAFADGQPAVAGISAEVLAVARAIAQGMMAGRLKLLVVLLMLTLGLAGAAALALPSAGEKPHDVAQTSAPDQDRSGATKVEPAAAKEDDAQAIVTGTVVDEAGKSVAGATVTAPNHPKSRPTTSAADGSFRLPLGSPPQEWLHATLFVHGQDGRLGAASISQRKPEPVRVVLKPAHELTVRVTDGGGKPVAGAEVHFLAYMSPFVAGRTDTGGNWTTRVPAGTTVWAVHARKAKLGFDYAVPGSRGSQEPPRPLPDKLALTLDGARTLRVKTVDRDGKAIPGVKVGPWYIQKTGREEDINLSGTTAFWPSTGADGMVLFDWFPEQIGRGLPIITRSDDFYAPDWNSLKQDKPSQEMTITMLPLEALSGRVTHADGRPAAGIRVAASGQGAGNYPFRGSARTGADGRYALKVFSEQAYVVAVTDDRWAAPYRSDIVVRAGKAVGGVDFVLGQATRLYGRVTLGTDDRPAPEIHVRLAIDKGHIPPELRREGDSIYHGVGMSFSAVTDKDGRFEFYVGPGEYRLYGPIRTEPVSIAIPALNPPAALVRDFRMPRPEMGTLAGQVIDAAGNPVAGAVLNGDYASSHARGFPQVKTDAEGRFKVERSLDPLVLHAKTADGTRAGMARVSSEAPEARVVVGPVASASGRLLDLEGQPLLQKDLLYGIRVYHGETEQSPFRDCHGGKAVTDAKGQFTLAGLVPGETYHVSFPLDNEYRSVTKVRPKSATRINLGDLQIDPAPRKPYVPPTPAERAAKAFAVTKPASPQARTQKVLGEARREYTRPLLLFGQPKDPATIDLFRLFAEQPEEPDAAGKATAKSRSPAQLRWEFELASFDTDQADVCKFAEERGIAGGKDRPPILAVLAADGSLTATFPLQLDKRQKLDSGALAAFLALHRPATRDAERMLGEALQKAKAQDKRVFFIASASWCGPCRLLSRFLDAHLQELERHYVFVKFDISRDDHADAVLQRFQGKHNGGVPWFAILDTAGKVLITSNAPDLKTRSAADNIGFPSSRGEIEHFLKMLQETAPGLSADQREKLRRGLTAKR
jgi:RNA polymerase sigma factor (sigma-70 family)